MNLTAQEVIDLVEVQMDRYVRIVEKYNAEKFGIQDRLGANNLAGVFAGISCLQELQHLISKSDGIKSRQLKKEAEN